MIRYIVGALIGGAGGYFIMYKLIGCSSGSCPITANPYVSTIYGMILGVLLAGSIGWSNDLVIGDSNQRTVAEYRTMTQEEAKARMDSKDEIIVLDVRTEAEYNDEHIPGAILIPNETITDEMPELLPDLDAEILVYCRSGNRSAQAAKKLLSIGYTNVYDFGGIINWPYDKAAKSNS